MTQPRVLLADDHAIRKILEPEYDLVGTAGDGRELLEISYRPLRGRFDEGPSKGPAVS